MLWQQECRIGQLRKWRGPANRAASAMNQRVETTLERTAWTASAIAISGSRAPSMLKKTCR
jgi:hypothetical protein